MDILDNLEKKYEPKKEFIYHKNKVIVDGKNMVELQKNIKQSIKNPSKDIKVFIVSFGYNKNSKTPFRINCVQYTITPKLNLVSSERDFGQSITYTKEELEKYGFNNKYLFKIIKGIKEGNIPIGKMGISISEVIKTVADCPKRVDSFQLPVMNILDNLEKKYEPKKSLYIIKINLSLKVKIQLNLKRQLRKGLKIQLKILKFLLFLLFMTKNLEHH
jgi:hypothetical protein